MINPRQLALELLQGRSTGRSRVQKTNLHRLLGQAAKNLDDGDGFPAPTDLGHQHRFEIGRHDVQADLGAQDALRDHALEMILVDDKLALAQRCHTPISNSLRRKHGPFWGDEDVGVGHDRVFAEAVVGDFGVENHAVGGAQLHLDHGAGTLDAEHAGGDGIVAIALGMHFQIEGPHEKPGGMAFLALGMLDGQ